jgi:hypothetical protein
MSSILKSSELIKSIKRRGFIPESQETFTAENFLEIATEKINIDLMSTLMDARGDYLVYFEDIPLEQGVLEYAIPDRAHGNKLRDASIVDQNGKNIRELTQISLEEISDFQFENRTNYGRLEPFYLMNNMVNLLSDGTSTGRFLRMSFYMRPNKLVLEARAATALSITRTTEVDSISPKSGTITAIGLDGVVTSPNHGLTTGDIAIISGSDSVPAIDGNQVITYIDANSFSVAATISVAGTVGSWSLGAEVNIIPSTLFPKHFTSDLLFDVVSSLSPNKIKLYNLQANSINLSLKTLSFRVKDTGTKIVRGDYITKAEETIVPNIPTEYHPLLAQMVSVSCMESMADEQQKNSANKTLMEMEKKILKIVSNRVEGAPKKIKNRHGTLMQSRPSRRGGR